MAALARQIAEQAGKGPTGLEETDRVALLQASEKLRDTLENPLEKFKRLFFVSFPEKHVSP